MKKNNTAQKTALEAEKISKALKEGTEKTLQNLLKEAVADMVNNSEDEEDNEEEPIEDDSFEVQDVETEETPEDNTDGNSDTDVEDGDEDTPENGDDTDDEWSDMEEYKVGDNDYDFTNVDGEMALKVYNKLGDNDQIYVKKEDDGTYSVKDDESGAEFVIELDPDGDMDNADADDEDIDLDMDMDTDNTEIELDMDDSNDTDDSDDELEIDIDDNNEDTDDEELEIDIDDDDDEELNEEKQEWTDNYQSKDPVAGMKMNTKLKNGTRDWSKGLPTGTNKPWAGDGDSNPFTQAINEKRVNPYDYDEDGCCPKCGLPGGECTCGTKKGTKKMKREVEESATTSKSNKRRMSKTLAPNSGDKEQPYVTRATSVAGEYLSEAKAHKIIEAAKAILAENKQYQEVINKVKQSLYEAAVLNTNYGKIVNLLVNETTTKAEKQSIVERFNEVKTMREGKQLYDSIKRELNESNNKKGMPRIDEQISANSSKTINETTIFQQTMQNNPSINLMERMDNLFQKKKH